MSEPSPPPPDLTQGVPIASLPPGRMMAGRVGDAQVLLARVGEEFLAVDSACTHYHGPLAEGLLVGDTVRCPWHHACFSLRSGEALSAPAFDALDCWSTEVRGDKVVVLHRKPATAREPLQPSPALPQEIVIIGGGAAGFAAAERLRREGYRGRLTMLSDDAAAPVDRPNLSKDYLAGQAPEEWIPLRDAAFYAEQHIDLKLNARASRLDTAARRVLLEDGSTLAYDRLLLATGAQPVRLPVPGMDSPRVFTLRSLADCRAIIARAAVAKRVAVLGASFIGLEVAAALRTRGLEVHVAAPEQVPMARVLGPELGGFVQRLHEQQGVVFHLGRTAQSIEPDGLALDDGSRLAADLVVVGVGVRPRVALAEQAGLAVDRGVLVDAFLQTSARDIYAAGDIARWPDPRSGSTLRVEHWVVAQRQGQTAALNMLGRRQRYDEVPFFWSQHYDVAIQYVGHAEGWDAIRIDGDVAARDCLLRYKRGGRTLAVASIGRDVESLKAELALAHDQPG
jgi:NADPH-dependent 2,4-dienoyl-CoA reductase/sulfur reductase-like enzyme/nitrite reductase/ring-hydroxylating ferredoxin subunit